MLFKETYKVNYEEEEGNDQCEIQDNDRCGCGEEGREEGDNILGHLQHSFKLKMHPSGLIIKN